MIRRYFEVLTLLFVLGWMIDVRAQSRERDTSLEIEVTNPPEHVSIHAKASLDVVSEYGGNIEYRIGTSYGFWVDWRHRAYMLTVHNVSSPLPNTFPGDFKEASRSDIAILYGPSYSDEIFYLSAVMGISIVDFRKSSIQIDDPRGEIYLGPASGSRIGLAGGVQAMISPTGEVFGGGMGFGLYGSLCSGNSFFAIEMMVHLSLSFPVHSKEQ